ncbi:MAG: type II toxin-antitoxin system RelB/DinJ family antitoxin [Synergistaceae bacterium]|nr:type II toxin-antitoxin system RelB/DinJ family antitoxin [Synergistaceae bacterium]
MPTAASGTEIVSIRLKSGVKHKAMENAEAVGIPLSTLISAFVTKFASEGVVPFEIRVPETPAPHVLAAIQELESGGGTVCDSIEEMYAAAGVTAR